MAIAWKGQLPSAVTHKNASRWSTFSSYFFSRYMEATVAFEAVLVNYRQQCKVQERISAAFYR